MAGGKETPRQKMIGMMYLVLTALLALQVSNAVLEKFIFIDETLNRQVGEMEMKSNTTISNISATVKEKGDRVEDVAALDKAKKVRSMTSELLSEMRQLRDTMVIITGGRDENGQIIGAKDYDIVGNYMVQKGQGKRLRNSLNKYAAELAEISGREFAPLAKDAKDIDIAKDDPNQNNKSFAEYYFQNTPTAAGMATISQIMTEVLSYESLALDRIAEMVGLKDVDFNIIVPMVRPVSNVVAAGAKYEADMFITGSATGLEPEMFMGETKLDVVEDEVTGIKMGKVSFTASGEGKQTFSARISLNDSVYVQPIEYTVVKPVIQIRSAALSSLYLNVCNELDVQVPALGNAYNPSFSSPQADVRKGAQTGKVTLIPKGRTRVQLTVSNDGRVLGTESFDVKNIPEPRIEISSRGREVNLKDGESPQAIRSLNIRAVAEENFAREAREDANYQVRKVSILLARGGRGVGAPQDFTSQLLDLSRFAQQARAGDILIFDVDQVFRRTCAGGNERVSIKSKIISLPIK